MNRVRHQPRFTVQEVREEHFLASDSGVDLAYADAQLPGNRAVRLALSPHPDHAPNVQGNPRTPGGLPLAWALRSPARTRSVISDRSNSAMAPMI